MNIFLRTFNNKINSKSGAPLPEGQYRGSIEWLQFQWLLIDCLNKLGHRNYIEVENPTIGDSSMSYDCHRRIYVHQCKRDRPNGDLFWQQMHMRELFTIDTNGWGADASNNNFKLGDVNEEDSKAFCENKSKELLNSGLSKCDQPQETSPTPNSYILVPVQIPRDYTIKNHSPITVRYFIESIQAWAIETETQVCFKMHPFNKVDKDLEAIIDQAADSSEYVRKVTGNIHELIRRSNGLFVINSGTGFEGLIHGKPVATFGACDYNRATWNADIRRLEEARNFLYSYTDEERNIGYQLVFWYWFRHAYDVNATDTPSRLTEYLRRVL